MSREAWAEAHETRLVALDERGLDAPPGRLVRVPPMTGAPRGGVAVTAKPKGDDYARVLFVLPLLGSFQGETRVVGAPMALPLPNRSDSHGLMTRFVAVLDVSPLSADLGMPSDCEAFVTETGAWLCDPSAGLAVHTRDWNCHPMDRVPGFDRAWGVSSWSLLALHPVSGACIGRFAPRSAD